MKRIEKNLAMSRDEKIAKVIREGHEIAEKMRKISADNKLPDLANQYEKYYTYIAKNFGYDKGTFIEDKYSDLNDYLSVAMGFAVDCIEPHTQELESLRQRYIDDFEEYLDSREWSFNEKSAR